MIDPESPTPKAATPLAMASRAATPAASREPGSVQYFALLKRAREEDERVRSGAYRLFNSALIAGLTLLFLSVIPAVPAATWIVVNVLMGVDVGGPLSDFFGYWIGASAVGAVLALLASLGRIAVKHGHEFTELTSEQQLFVTLREAHEALERYGVTHLPRDRREAERLLQRVRVDDFHPDYHESHVIFSWLEVAYQAQRFPWIEVAASTGKILDGLRLFLTRVIPRVKEDLDLDAVASVLFGFSEFLYAFLPEHVNRIEASEVVALRTRGMQAALDACERMGELSDIETRGGAADTRRGPRRLVVALLAGVQSSNPLVRFAAWFGVLMVLTAAIVVPSAIVFHLGAPIMVPVFVSTPLLCAATLTIAAR